MTGYDDNGVLHITRPGRGNTAPSTARGAKKFDPDSNVWERQPSEEHDMYQMFLVWRDSEARQLTMFDDPKYADRGWSHVKARDRSSIWSWGYRAWSYDRFVGAQETADMVRYRVTMRERQRAIGRTAQAKVAQWLMAADPKSWKPLEAARWCELAVAVEREAALATPGTQPKHGETDTEADDSSNQTLADVVGVDPTLEVELGAALHEMLKTIQR